MKVHKLVIEDVIPLMITYRFNLVNELVICGFINIITGGNIPRGRSQYIYGMKVLGEHIESIRKQKN